MSMEVVALAELSANPADVPPAPLTIKDTPPSPTRNNSKSPSSHTNRPPTLTYIDDEGASDSSLTIRTSSIATASSAGTLTALEMSGMNMTTESLTSPEPLPASPASKALDKAIDKKKLKLLDKRLSIGKTKLGHTYYKSVERSFKPPAGNVINLQHEQYALTYGMMCGIRDSAGLQKPFKQRLAMDDFMLVDRKIFPANSQLQHPFKFKDYSPDVFRQVRRRFGIDLAEYMLTLSGDFNFIEFMSNSKSGQFFFYSHDGRYMIKTQTKDESKFLRRILPHYYKFVMENPNTLITRFYGMHRVKMHHLRRKMHFVIMASVFHTPLEIHGRFDLKGSRIGRHASPAEHARGGAGVLKDMDLLEKGFHLQLGVARRAIFLVQLRKDVEFLKRMKIMDYSLLIGVHDSSDDLNNDFYAGSPIASGAESLTPPSDSEISRSMPSSPTHSDLNFPTYSHTRAARSASVPEYNLSNLNNVNLRSTCPAAIPPSLQSRLALSPPSTPTWSDGAPDFDSDNDSELDDSTSSEGGFFGTAFGDTSLAERCSGSLPSTPRGAAMPPLSPRLLDTTAYAEFSESIFCKDDGGIYGRDRHGRKNGFVYFLGIIDILQQYNTRKIAETFFKGLRHNRKQISAVNPDFYGDRFIEFMEKHVVQDDTLPLPSPRPLPSPSTRDAAVIDTMTRMEEEAAC